MAYLIEKLHEDANSPAARVIPPGWMTIQQLQQLEKEREIKTVKDFEESISKYLPQAAQKVQDLVNDLHDKLDITVPISYLTIENGTTFHVVMLVRQKDYLSPHMVAARILTERSNAYNTDFDIHYTFTVDIQYQTKSSMIPNSYRLKHVPDFDKNLEIELVYMRERA